MRLLSVFDIFYDQSHTNFEEDAKLHLRQLHSQSAVLNYVEVFYFILVKFHFLLFKAFRKTFRFLSSRIEINFGLSSNLHSHTIFSTIKRSKYTIFDQMQV